MYWWERWLADLGYLGAVGLVVKFKYLLTWGKLYYKNIHEWYRNRIETIISVVKAHRSFHKGDYQGNYAHLVPLVTIVGHVTAYELRRRQFFDTVHVGSWWHKY